MTLEQTPKSITSLPMRKLYTGALLPSIGLGTFGSDHASGDLVVDVVQEALRIGYQ